jgi:cyclophilin family peptidyl-prolyl cis-trans isomerase
MQKMQKPSSNLLLIPLILASSVLLAGCGPETPEDDFVLELNQTEPVAQEQTNQVPPRKEPAVKTIKDFEPIEAKQMTLTTSKGDIVIELFREKAPLTTLNFLSLAKEKFYDGIVFHRVVPGFVVQVGDPTTKDPNSPVPAGSGGPGYTIPDEFNPDLRHSQAGILSMANAGPNTGGSQIFITLDATPHLDDLHAVFGQVTAGMDVVNSIEQGDKIISATYQ